MVIDVAERRIVDTGQTFCRPQFTPVTPFCESLTGISGKALEGAGTLADALAMFERYAIARFAAQGKSFCLVCDGRWDLGIQLPREARQKGIGLSSFFGRYFDVKVEFARWLAHKPGVPVGGRTISGMCETLGIKPEGRAHSGLDDSVNIARIVLALLEGGFPDVFARPEDTAARIEMFQRLQSTVVLLRGLAFKARSNDIHAWFNDRGGFPGLAPTQLLLIMDRDNRPSGTCFAVFDSHDSACRALLMNGFVMGTQGRYIEVYPSCQVELDAVSNVVPLRDEEPAQPYHLQHHQQHFFQHQQHQQQQQQQIRNRPAVRFLPGDWMCSCGRHNFARRSVCSECAQAKPEEAGGVAGASSNGGGGGGGGVPGASRPNPQARFLPGDWLCPKCNHHNFARRFACEICAGPKPEL